MASLLFQEGHDGPKGPDPQHRKKQLLNNMLDGMARVRPQTVYAEVPKSFASYEPGYRSVTYAALANAVNGIAWWFTEQLGPGKDFQTVCYMGWNDIRYVMMVLGAVKAEYKILLVSPRNSQEANINLFKTLKCKVLATTDPKPPTLVDIGIPLQTLIIPSVDDLLNKTYANFPFNKTFAEARNEPLVALHTSGTTGLPKPIIYTHDFAAANIKMTQLDPPEGFESMDKVYQGSRVFMLLPPFHASSMFGPLMEALSNQTIIIYPLATAVPSAASLAETVKWTPVNVGCLPPPMVMEIATNPQLFETLSEKLDVIFFGGGDLPQSFGDVLSSKFKFWTSNGSTETGPYPLIRQSGDWPTEEWKYNCVHPAAGLEYRHRVDDLYEAYVVRNQDPEEEQPVFKIYPDLQEYATKDLFSRHPTKSHLWTYRGRADDMINLASGTINPTAMDHAIADCPEVQDGLMVPVGKYSRERFATNAGLLVQPKPGSTASREELIGALWPGVEEANKKYRAEAQVSKDNIVFAVAERPLPRNPKGMVQRSKALDLYAEELEAL